MSKLEVTLFNQIKVILIIFAFIENSHRIEVKHARDRYLSSRCEAVIKISAEVFSFLSFAEQHFSSLILSYSENF